MIPDYVAAAVADTHRPDADTKRDASRKPAEVLAFSGVKPGDKVFELLPGGGYFTRLFSKAVGPGGHVYAVAPTVNPETGAAVPADGRRSPAIRFTRRQRQPACR